MTKKTNLPKKTAGDYNYSIVKAVAGSLPVGGSLLSALMEIAIIPPYEKRKQEWMQSIDDSLEELQFKIDDLANNEVFLDALVTATKSAMATRSKIKQECLRNALLNIVLNTSADEIRNSIFLNFVDRFTEAHIKICGILNSPSEYRNPLVVVKETPRELIKKQLPKLTDQLTDVIVKELYDNLLSDIRLPNNGQSLGLDDHPPLGSESNSRLTELGKEFVDFIKKPNSN